jgi:hypothetical protein
VGAEVEARLEAVGEDRALWPRTARETASQLEAKVAMLGGAMATLQRELDQEAAGRRAEAHAKVGGRPSLRRHATG